MATMAELEVDQSNLPKVQEVCQCFAVLEDGALAHNLQEQEIEQHYSSNVEKNQLVQRDIRMARRLQDEEEQEAYLLQRQASRQLEERDSEYARIVQGEIQRRAEESRRREREDEEIAKRIQEEEDSQARHRGRGQGAINGEGVSVPPPPPPYTPPRQPAPTFLSEEEEEELYHHQLPPPSRWRPSPSLSDSDSEEGVGERCRSPGQRESGQVRGQARWDYRNGHGHRSPLRRSRRSAPPSVSSSSQDDRNGHGHRSPLRRSRRSAPPSVSSSSQDDRGPATRKRLAGGWADAVRLIKHDLSEQGYLSHSSDDELLFQPVYQLEDVLSRRRQASRPTPGAERRGSVREQRAATWWGDGVGRERRESRGDGPEDGGARRYSSSSRVSRTSSLSYRESNPRHVHFQDQWRRCGGYWGDGQRAVGGSLGGSRGQGEWVGTESRNTQSHLREDRSGHHVAFIRRDAPVRRSYHGDVRQARRASMRVNSNQNGHHRNGSRPYESSSNQEFRAVEPILPNHLRERGEVGRHGVEVDHRGREEVLGDRRYPDDRIVQRIYGYGEERSSTEEEEEVEREERRQRRREERRPAKLQRSFSLSYRGRSSRAGLPGGRDRGSLEMGDLQQVLLDEELARRLQEEEEDDTPMRGSTRSSDPPRRPYPEGDFRVAQVAQDEEIARFMQKQEMRANPRSREPEVSGEMPDLCDRRAGRQRQVRRERLDSEGLPSPAEDRSPDRLPPSSVAVATPPQPMRNIAEELDPTFGRRESLRAEQSCSGPSLTQPAGQMGSRGQGEEPAFVPPTKRQNDKPARAKAREKKENGKQRESCKQQ